MFDFIKSLFKGKPDVAKLAKEGAVIVDVRTKGEYQAGHIEGSRNIPLDNIKKEAAVVKNLNKPVVTVCRSGNRSGMAKSILAAAGIEAYNGGAWTNLKRQIQ
jgi:rhodanese-related sulfurtransferase